MSEEEPAGQGKGPAGKELGQGVPSVGVGGSLTAVRGSRKGSGTLQAGDGQSSLGPARAPGQQWLEAGGWVPGGGGGRGQGDRDRTETGAEGWDGAEKDWYLVERMV